jgi:putative salt-induced outer membrane protein YdiY
MSVKTFIRLLCVLCVFSFGLPVVADEVYLANGDRISGTVVKKAGDTLTIKTDFAGEIGIAWDKVVSVSTDVPVVVQLDDATLIAGTLARSGDGTVSIEGSNLVQAGQVPVARVALINPPAPQNGVKLSGRANVGVYIAKGNTDKEAYHGDIESVARTKQNRFTAGAIYNQALDDGMESENNAMAYLKYDHFFTEKWYTYANTVLFKDDFADLNLRSSLGLGAGYQFVESELTNLSLEGGLSYVNEDFDLAPDDSYPAARWSLNYDHFLYPNRLQFFHFHEGLLGLQDTKDIIIITRTGLRAMLTDSFIATAEVDVDWDNTPSPGNDRVDTRYLFNLGYGW